MFLLADSQLLFHREDGTLFLERVRAELGPGPHRAAYLGASNGDEPAFYDLFVAAMAGIDVTDCRMIPSVPSQEDRSFLEEAHLILLAGGDVARGLAAFHENGLAERILARFAAGAVLVGVSAGAVQLGQRLRDAERAFRLAPVVVSVHDEPEWTALSEAVVALEGAARGVGIPSGGGAVVHPDLSIEPVRKALVEISLVEGEVRRALLMPERRAE
jgi:hypothetical protein